MLGVEPLFPRLCRVRGLHCAQFPIQIHVEPETLIEVPLLRRAFNSMKILYEYTQVGLARSDNRNKE